MHYELITIIPGSRTETEIPPIKDTLRTLLTGGKATILQEEDLGKQRLAYPIKSEHYGTYCVFAFDCEPEHLAHLHNQLRLSEHLLRHSLVKKERKTPEQLEEEARRRARIHHVRQVRKDSVHESSTAIGGTPKEETKAAAPINLEELDKKLDELLDTPVEKI